jgi:hypothetical protein
MVRSPNHHSIVEVGGKTYLFYHDTQLSNGVNHLRNVKQPIELTYNDDGTIKPVDAYLGDSIAADANAKWVAEPAAPAADAPAPAPAPAPATN